jgi:hypothetical protein
MQQAALLSLEDLDLLAATPTPSRTPETEAKQEPTRAKLVALSDRLTEGDRSLLQSILETERTRRGDFGSVPVTMLKSEIIQRMIAGRVEGATINKIRMDLDQALCTDVNETEESPSATQRSYVGDFDALVAAGQNLAQLVTLLPSHQIHLQCIEVPSELAAYLVKGFGATYITLTDAQLDSLYTLLKATARSEAFPDTLSEYVAQHNKQAAFERKAEEYSELVAAAAAEGKESQEAAASAALADAVAAESDGKEADDETLARIHANNALEEYKYADWINIKFLTSILGLSDSELKEQLKAAPHGYLSKAEHDAIAAALAWSSSSVAEEASRITLLCVNQDIDETQLLTFAPIVVSGALLPTDTTSFYIDKVINVTLTDVPEGMRDELQEAHERKCFEMIAALREQAMQTFASTIRRVVMRSIDAWPGLGENTNRYWTLFRAWSRADEPKPVELRTLRAHQLILSPSPIVSIEESAHLLQDEMRLDGNRHQGGMSALPLWPVAQGVVWEQPAFVLVNALSGLPIATLAVDLEQDNKTGSRRWVTEPAPQIDGRFVLWEAVLRRAHQVVQESGEAIQVAIQTTKYALDLNDTRLDESWFLQRKFRKPMVRRSTASAAPRGQGAEAAAAPWIMLRPESPLSRSESESKSAGAGAGATDSRQKGLSGGRGTKRPHESLAKEESKSTKRYKSDIKT